MNTNCSTCNNYLLQLRRAKARRDEDNYLMVRALYVEHLKKAHPIGKAQPVTREAVRAAFGKWGE